MQSSIDVRDVGLKFRLNKERSDTLFETIRKFMRGVRPEFEEFWALKDISFSINPGDRLAILGSNGAGKSTLLKVIAGVLKPTEGSIRCEGRIAPLLELGAGFNLQYTAWENIYLYGAILGYSRAFLDEKVDEIIQFANLRKFADVPIKNYSSGMRARLGFSICTAVQPDILILDEVLAVGDAKFRIKSAQRIDSLINDSMSVLFVSHSVENVLRICNKGMILADGRIVAYGDLEEIVERYTEMTEA